MVVLPEPLGPRRPTISPGPTARETRSTARRGPYHLVSCSAAMTAVVKAIVPMTPPGWSPTPAGRYIQPVSSSRLLELLRIVTLGRLGRRAVEVVGGHEARVLAPLQDPDELVRVQDARRVVGQRDVRQQVLRHVLGEVHVVAREHDGAGLRQTHDGHLAAR